MKICVWMTGPQWVVRLEKKERSAMKMNVETLETHFFCYHYIFLLQWTLEKEISRCIFLVAFFFFPTLFRVSQIQKETSQTHISIGFTTSKGFHNYLLLQAGLAFFVQNCEFLMKHYCQETIIILLKKITNYG